MFRFFLRLLVCWILVSLSRWTMRTFGRPGASGGCNDTVPKTAEEFAKDLGEKARSSWVQVFNDAVRSHLSGNLVVAEVEYSKLRKIPLINSSQTLDLYRESDVFKHNWDLLQADKNRRIRSGH